MKDIFNDIKKRLEKMPTYKTGNGYEYFVYPYKGITPIDDGEIKYLADIITSKIPKDVDLIFTVETDGIFTALPVAMAMEKPLVSARWFNYKMDKSFSFMQKTGYHKRKLYFYFDPKEVKKVAIIDCVLSTGGTIKAALNLFEELGVEVAGIYTVINKVNYSDKNFISQIKDKLFSLFDVEIKSKRIIVERSKYNK